MISVIVLFSAINPSLANYARILVDTQRVSEKRSEGVLNMHTKSISCRSNFRQMDIGNVKLSLPSHLWLVAVLCCCFAGCTNGEIGQESAVETAPSDSSVAQFDPVEPVVDSNDPAVEPADPEVLKIDPAVAPAVALTEPKTNTSNPKGGMSGIGKMKLPMSKDIKFKNEIKTNVQVPTGVSDLTFVDTVGNVVKLSDFSGKQNVILVFTEGFNGMICPFCTTQTSRLVANYDEFKKRNCEVIVVYPGPSDRVEEFVEAALKTEKSQVDKVPFPIVLDKDFKATDFFDIHSTHAHPSTYLIDKQGGVKFAYVGKNMTADRPSVKALLSKLDAIEK